MSYRVPATGLCAATALFVCGVAGFPVPPAALPPAQVAFEISADEATSLVAGQDLSVTAPGFADEAAVTIALYSTPQTLAQVVADDTGTVDTTVVLPDDLLGEHTLVAIGLGPDGTAHTVQSEVSIAAAAVAAGPASSTQDVVRLARTGVSTAATIAGALGLVLAGLVLIRTSVMGRRFLPVA